MEGLVNLFGPPGPGSKAPPAAKQSPVEAGNVRHEHEWRVWEDTRLPVVGRENVIASTDCRLGGRVHPQIPWAKLETLGEGSRRASKRLW